MKYASDSYLYQMFALLLRTGMRGGEARGLKYSDVDKTKKVIRVRRTLKYEAGIGFFEDMPKTEASLRDIPMTKEIEAIIEAQKKFWQAHKVVKLDEYIFHIGDGTPISRERLQGEIDRIIRKMSLQKPLVTADFSVSDRDVDAVAFDFIGFSDQQHRVAVGKPTFKFLVC